MVFFIGGKMFKKKNKELTEEEKEVIRTKSFFDMILPSTIKFSTDHYVCGDSYRCVWAIKEYPPTTEELALFSTLADRNNLTIHLYSRMVDAIEQRKIIQNATRKNKLSTGSNDVQENITAEGNLEDVVNLIAELRKNKEPLLHCAVFLELKADSMQKLRELQSEIQMELTRSKMSVDRLDFLEYKDFEKNPSRENADELITQITESHADFFSDRGTYLKYISERPRVQIVSKTGLFSDAEMDLNISRISREISESQSNVWTHIISLKREDAQRLGYDSVENWMLNFY